MKNKVFMTGMLALALTFVMVLAGCGGGKDPAKLKAQKEKIEAEALEATQSGDTAKAEKLTAEANKLAGEIEKAEAAEAAKPAKGDKGDSTDGEGGGAVSGGSGKFGYGMSIGGIIIMYETTNAADIVIPEKIEDIPVVAISADAFRGKESLESITFPDTVTEIPNGAFYGCEKLASVKKFPAKLVRIGNNAFRGTALSSITLPDGLTSIGEGAFRGTPLGEITLSDGLTSIGNTAFYNCVSLITVKMGNNVTSIGESAFGDCYNLTSVTLSEKLETLGGGAFAGNWNMTTLNVPASLKVPGGNAFQRCFRLPLDVRRQIAVKGYRGDLAIPE